MSNAPARHRRYGALAALALCVAALVPAAPASGAAPPTTARLPGYVASLTARHLDGQDDDLLTAGLGLAGLREPDPPGFADPEHPTPAELRRLAIWGAAGLYGDDSGGLGRLYGPDIGPEGRPVPGDGRIPGTEYTATAGTGADPVTFVVQVPDDLDRSRPCVVAAPAAGLLGVYQAIGGAGAWALHRGCAVAYTDKGMGPGFHDLASDTVMAADGTTGPRAELGDLAVFDAGLSDAARERYNARSPYRIAFKQAHSGRNPQATWGRDTVRAVELALALLNREHRAGGPSDGYTPENTTVIAAGVSNGGGAVLAAGEQDRRGLIDAVVAAAPQLNLAPLRGVAVRQGGVRVPAAGMPLVRYGALAALLQPCAVLADPQAPGHDSFDRSAAARRCAALVGDDPRLVSRADAAAAGPAGLPELAQRALVRAGFQPTSGYLQASHYDPQTPVSYAMSFARASAADALCGYSWAATDADGRPAPYTAAQLAAAFATSGGRAPAPGTLINDRSHGGPVADRRSLGPDGRPDYNLAGERCVYRLAFGDPATAAERAWADRVAQGLDETRRDGDLGGRPALVVQGRDDARVPVNHSARPYLGLNARAEGEASRLSYVEVTNAHHSDSTAAGFDNRYVPLGYYYQQALDLMWDHLTTGRALPPSQVVRTVPRGGEPGRAPELTPANVPPIAADPAPGDRVRLRGTAVDVPD
ncbi:D-(-)-3-hydroxybutyrate oligomer hydrolase [Streptomyces sp. 8K308]|uniref:3-hydroxybutyrate oligomer hydrolase family protein n=1 Tax=Streptomyces sp. 8K308 TaxID=2530388 RepID=UPI0010475F27|nr:3-hydroxybutyrate oligomer hydrolase family protein [Streptomyces sp. 8K308]TDC26400.1 D-(-)-3-hydroxybutyrate oligomer hydrolase [Streptomyces sp. 8K308]